MEEAVGDVEEALIFGTIGFDVLGFGAAAGADPIFGPLMFWHGSQGSTEMVNKFVRVALVELEVENAFRIIYLRLVISQYLLNAVFFIGLLLFGLGYLE